MVNQNTISKSNRNDPDVYYELSEDGQIKEELTYQKICEQLGKPRFRETGIRNSRFSLITETLRKR